MAELVGSGNKYIWITFQRKGFHCYPGAPAEVAYLALEHRHLFKFKVKIEVFDNDREIEFHMFQTFVESLYDGVLKLDYKSCEMLADELADELGDRYSGRRCIIEVSEDGECGCECEYVL